MRIGTHRPISSQLVDLLVMEILDGSIKAGNKLPPVKELALMTKINPQIVSKACQELVKAGVVKPDAEGRLIVCSDAVVKLQERERQRFLRYEVPELARRMRLLGVNPLSWIGRTLLQV